MAILASLALLLAGPGDAGAAPTAACGDGLICPQRWAEPCRAVPPAQGDAALKLLKKGLNFVQYCEPCGGKRPGDPQVVDKAYVSSAKTFALTGSDFEWGPPPLAVAVSVNDEPKDLASLFIQRSLGDAHYENVAVLVKCPVKGVSPEIDLRKFGALTDVPAEPEEFRALEQRLTLFNITLQEDRESLKDWFSRQTAAAKELKGDYLRFSRTAPPDWRVASLFRAANVLERLADAIDAIKTPRSTRRLGDEAIVAYRDALNEKSGGLRQDAQSGYGEAVAWAEQLGVQGHWATSAREGERRLAEHERKHQIQGRPCKKTSECGNLNYLCMDNICRFNDSRSLVPKDEPHPSGRSP